MQQATTTPAVEPRPLCGSLTVDPDRVARMWAMTPYERVAAFRRGELSVGDCGVWQHQEPGTLPTVDGELFYIALLMADLDPD